MTVFAYLEGMEVHFTPEVQAKLEQIARDTGRRSDQLVENVVSDFVADLDLTRDMLDRRYDDLESGRVKPIPGDEVIARLRARSTATRKPKST
jgi:predicted transcriptional regulator